jgi:hypothetical protein
MRISDSKNYHLLHHQGTIHDIFFFTYFIYISSSKSPSLTSKNNRLINEKKKALTSLIASWICQSMRPIGIVENEGFLSIIQQCLSWTGGEKNLFK